MTTTIKNQTGSHQPALLPQRLLVGVAVMVLLPVFLLPAAAQLYWDTNGSAPGAGGTAPAGTWDSVTANWSTAASGNVATTTWTSGQTAIFSAGTDATGLFTVTLSGAQTAAGLTVEEGTVTLGGSGLTLSAPTITINASTKATINAIVSGTSGLTKAGAGELVLAGPNDFTGGLTFNAGTLTLNNNSAASSGSMTFNAAATLILKTTENITLANNINLGGTGANPHEFAADSGKTLTLNGVISNSRNWRANGAGTVILGGVSPNTFAGSVTVAQGTLIAAKDKALGSTLNGTIVNSGATLGFQGGYQYTDNESVTINGTGSGGVGAILNVSGDNEFWGTVTLASASTIGAASGSRLDFVGPVSGALPLTKSGLGQINLFGNANNYTTTLVSQGTLGVWFPANAGTSLATVNAGATLVGDGNVPGGIDLSGTLLVGDYYPGQLDSGSQTWRNGARLGIKITDATGTAGNDPGWDWLNITGILDLSPITAGNFTLEITSLDALYNPGDIANFDNTQEYDWTIASATMGITGFDDTKFVLDDSAFANALGGGRFVILHSGNNLVLRFDPAPVITCPANFTQANDPGNCSASVAFAASVTDNQPGVVLTYTNNGVGIVSGHVFPVGTHTVNVTATDSVGNTDTCSFIVTITDNQNPAAIAQNVSKNLDGSGNATVTVVEVNNGSTDNCSITNYAVRKTASDPWTASVTYGCSETGANTIYLRVMDASGNVGTTSATVTITDNQNPAAIAQNVSKNLDGAGSATVTALEVNNNSTDNCSLTTYEVSKSAYGPWTASVTYDCSETGANTIHLRVTDASGNVGTASATVNITDNIAPVIALSPISVTLNSAGEYTLTPANIASLVSSATDNCGIATTNVSPTTFSYCDVAASPVTVTVTVTDVKGNATNVNTTVTVNAPAAAPAVVYVDGAYPASGCAIVTHPVAPGTNLYLGYNAFKTIQLGVNNVAVGGIIHVNDGIYDGQVMINKTVTLLSANGSAVTTIRDSSATGLGTVQLVAPTTGVQIGAINHGFTIQGVDSPNPGIEFAAIYLQGNHTNTTIVGNNIVAAGDEALLTEYSASVVNLVITDNEISGQTFNDPPAGNGFGDQFTLANVPRQLVVIQPGSGPVTFSRNLVSGTSGGTNTSDQPQGNTLVTIDAANATIQDNNFTGLSTRFATALRIGGANTLVTGNVFPGNTPGGLFIRTAAGPTAQVNFNSFSSYTAGWALQAAAGPVNAVSNWWDNLSGPYSATLNPYGTGVGVSGNATISPWLATGTDTSGAIGFQPAAPVNYPPTHLVFVVQPGNAALGGILSTNPVVEVRDVNETVTPWAQTNINVVIGSNPGGGILTGTIPQFSTSGVATFNDLAITVGGGAGYTLVASAPGLTNAISEPFDIGNPTPSIASLNPAGAVTGSNDGSIPVTIAGNNFVPMSVVLVGGDPVAPVFNSASQLTVSLSTATVGSYSVVVSNPAVATTSGALTFTVGDQPSIVYVDDNYGPGNSGTHVWGFDAFATIADGINAVTTGGQVIVAAGTYAPVNANKPVTLLGANAGTACGGSGDSIIAGGTGTAVTIAANNVTVDGFALTGAIGVSNTGYTGAVVQNNQINTAAQGVALQSIAGTFTIQDNCITLSNQLAGATPSVGIVVAGTTGGATVIEDNTISGAFYGSLLYAVNNSPAVTVKGGTISGVMQGVAVINVDLDPAPPAIYLPSTFAVDGVSMSGFTGDYTAVPALAPFNFHAGVYVFTGGADTAAVVEGTITGVTVDGTGRISPDSAGMNFADFSTGAGTRQDITVTDCTLLNNKNRGISVRGGNAQVQVVQSTFTGNGQDPHVTGGNDGFTVVARNAAQLTVEECFITHPASVVGALPVTALAAHVGAQVTAFGNAVDNNACPTGRFGHNDGDSGSLLDASGNWWGGTAEATIAAGMLGAVDFTPYLASGTDSDGGTAGFQGDFSTLHVTALGAQTTGTRVQEGVDWVADGVLSGASRIVDVRAGTYTESVYIWQPVRLTGPNHLVSPNGGTRVAEAHIKFVAWYGIYLDVADVLVSGFTFDGQTTCDYGVYGYTATGAGGLTVSHNIIKDCEIYGFLGWTGSAGGNPASSNNTIQQNRFDNAGQRSVVPLWNYYANVLDNVITNTVVGIYTENAFKAEATGLVRWAGNTISATRAGIWYNLAYGTATPLTITNNSILAQESAGLRFSGVWLTSIGSNLNPVIGNNSITIPAGGITPVAVGYDLWNDTTTAGIQIFGGSVVGADYGVWVNNFDGFPTATGSNGGSTAATVNGVTITDAVLAGVYVKDNPLNSNGATVRATVTGNALIDGIATATGVLVEGPDASAIVLNNTASITGNAIGIDVNAGKAKLQNNNLTGNTIAIQASNGATVDAGACGLADITGGLGASTGGNILTGYLTSGNAIVNSASTVRAYGNSFGATPAAPAIAGAFTGPVSASQSAGLLVSPTVPGTTVQCPGDVPPATNTLAAYLALGGVVSATDGVTLTSADGPVTGVNAPYEGTVTRTFILTDACGQTNSTTQVFIVDDTTVPVVSTWPTNRVIAVDSACAATVPDLTVEVVATDNCGNPVAVSQLPVAGTVLAPGVTPVTVTVADTGSNSVAQAVQLTVVDPLAPSITCPPDVTINRLDAADPYATGMATATDGCTNVTVTYTDNRAGLTNCNATGVLLRTWTAKDAANNTASCVQTITVTDTVAPLFTSTQTNIVVANDAGLCSAVVTFPTPTAIDEGYFQGFENPDWVSGSHLTMPSVDWNNYNSQMARAASGTDGIVSKSGSAHAVINSNAITGWTGAFGRLGGYYNTFGTGFRASVDVYLDLSNPAVAANTYGWNVSVAANNQSGSHRRDFIFHAAGHSPGKILIAADNNSNFARRNDLASLNHYEVTNSGWYTFEWVFRDNGSGALAVDLNLRDSSGAWLWTETRSDPSDLISTLVGGNRYMWFTFLAVDKLAIDNTTLERNSVVTSTPHSGYAFPVGITTVTNIAADHCGNTATNTFTVTVNDTQPPTISVVADITVNNDIGQCGANVTFADPVVNDNCGISNTVQTAGLASNSLFPVGVTTNVFVVSDIHGNTATNSFKVTVLDVQPPTISFAGDITVNNDLNVCGAAVTYPAPTTADNCGVSATNQLAGLSSGSTFPVGITTNVYVVTDIHGNSATNSFTVTVTDTEPPVATAGSIASCYTTQAAAEAAAIAATSGTDNCGVASTNVVSVTGSCPATITVRVTDIHNNYTDVTYSTRIDAEAPVLGAIAATQGVNNVKNGANTVLQGVVSINVVASDNCSLVNGHPTVSLINGASNEVAVCVATNAGNFDYVWPVTAATAGGTWTVTVTASDICQQTNTTFTLEVNKNEISGQIALQDFTGTNRTVVFVATDGASSNATPLMTWTVPLNFTNGLADYKLTSVPDGTLGLSAKTAWSLRRKLGVTLVDGQATVSFTGTNWLRGGDIGTNPASANKVLTDDYLAIVNNWLSTTTPASDITGNGPVNFADYSVMAQNWGQEGDPE